MVEREREGGSGGGKLQFRLQHVGGGGGKQDLGPYGTVV